MHLTSIVAATTSNGDLPKGTRARLDNVCGPAGDWQNDLCRTIYEPGGAGRRLVAEIVHGLTTTGLAIVLIIAGAWLINRLARRCVVRLGRQMMGTGRITRGLSVVRRMTPDALLETQEFNVRGDQRREAVLGILKSVITVLIYATALVMVLSQIGVDLAPLLAGAGVLGVALGFGAQSLVGDFLSGVFILVEDQYGVGDEVTFNPRSASGSTVTGTVEALSLRNTRLRGLDGTVWHVPNGEMRALGNQSQHWSRAVLDIPIALGADVAHAKAVIARVAEQVREHDPSVLEPPEVWGVQELGVNGMSIRLVVKTKPSEQWRITRAIRERLVTEFRAEGIAMPAADSPSGAPLSSA